MKSLKEYTENFLEVVKEYSLYILGALLLLNLFVELSLGFIFIVALVGFIGEVVVDVIKNKKGF